MPYSNAALLMPVRSLLFRPEAGTPLGPRPGHLVGIGRERQSPPKRTKVSKYRMERDAGLPRDLMTARKNSISENARAHDESSSPQRRFAKRSNWFRLSAPAGRAHIVFENEEDGVRVGGPQGRIRCPKRFTTYRPIGERAP